MMPGKSVLLRLLLLLIAALLLVAIAFIATNSFQETREMTEEVRKESSGKFIALKKGITHYRLEGADSLPLVVLVHGGGASGYEVYHESIPYLRNAGYQVLTYDLYNRGYSARLDEENTPELFLTQLTDLLEALSLKQPFHIVGMSMGAIVSLDYIHLYPERVKKIVLIDPAATGEFRMNTFLKVPVISSLLMTFYWYPRTIENQRKDFVNNDVFDQYAVRLNYFMKFKGFKETNYSTWSHTLNQNKLPYLEGFPENHVLLVYGKQDPYFPSGSVVRYQSVYPSIRVVAIDQAGHIPHMEKPEEVTGHIIDFFRNEGPAINDNVEPSGK